jgi:hypothetical protein
MAEPDYSKFSREDLQEEVRREEEALATYRADLAEAEQRRDDLIAATSDERIAQLEARTTRRQERIARYERSIAELNRQISRYQTRVADRQTEIRTLEDSVGFQEARLPRVTGMERFITSEVIGRLRRSIAILQGWQTRDTRYLGVLQDTRATNNRILAALRAWQVREAGLLERVNEMRAELAGVLTTIASLTALIQSEQARLERKRSFLAFVTLTITVSNIEWGTTTPTPGKYSYSRDTIAIVTAQPKEGYGLSYWEQDSVKVQPHPGNTINVRMDTSHTLNAVFTEVVKQLVHAKIIVYSVCRSGRPARKYTKRFQAFFNVDAIRDQATGEIDYSSKLTEKEIDACIDYFYALWNWASLPSTCSTPVWIESGEFEFIDEPQGADLKQASVREKEEETWNKKFTPPEVVYSPTPAEKDEMMKLVKK